jgi:hypothetical protein
VIHDEVAYAKATKAHIIANAKKTWNKNPENAELVEWLMGEAWNAPVGSFIKKMADNYDDWGSLTPKMVAVLKKIKAEKAEKKAANEAKWAAEKALSNWIGEVGKKVEIEAKVIWKVEYETMYGMMTVTGLKAGNDIIVHKGKNVWPDKGEMVKAVVKVKEHKDYKGTKETIVWYPKNIEHVAVN